MKNESCCPTSKESCDTDKDCAPKCCPFTLLKGALIGGLLMFAIYSASWMYSPLHKNTMFTFKNEAAVSKVLAANAPQSGVYALPGDMKSGAAKPSAFTVVRLKGVEKMGEKMADGNCPLKCMMLMQLGLCLVGAALLTKILKRNCCGCPIKLSFGVGLLVAAFAHLPGMIWFRFPLDYTLVGMLDDVVAVTIAGAAISCCAIKSGFCSTTGKKKK